jgi:plasmid stabilization system protein ParE
VKIRFLASSSEEIDWFLLYYHRVFPEGQKNAKDNYRKTLQLLKETPLAGQPIPNSTLRIFPILRTPFAIVYRPTHTEILIAHVLDMRRDRSNFQFIEKP